MSGFSFDTNAENGPLRDIIYGKDFGEKLEKFADSFRAASLKIEDRYKKKKQQLDTEMHKELAALAVDYKKKLSVSIKTPKDETPTVPASV